MILCSKDIFIMEYISFSDNIIDFILRGNIIKLNWYIDSIINIVEVYLSKCQYLNIDKNILTNKLENIINNINNNENLKNIKLKECFEYLFEKIDYICSIKIPQGICHGDLTFSNILIDTHTMKLYLIDLLDSFIESPLLDIIKIRQDTQYHWTLNLYKFNYDKNKIYIIFNNMG